MAAPAFFVPDVVEDETEATYADLAEVARRELPPPDRRVWRIQWVHDGQRWTAEVGERLHGEQIAKVGARRPGHALSDDATVRAIFAGGPGQAWVVVTDGRPLGPVRSGWLNPFMAGQPGSVEYFSPPPSD